MNWRTLIRDFRDYWSPKSIASRMDDWTHSFRAATHQKPDPKVERRREERGRKT